MQLLSIHFEISSVNGTIINKVEVSAHVIHINENALTDLRCDCFHRAAVED